MDELVDRIEELAELNAQLKTNNEQLEKQVSELLDLEEKGVQLRAELDAANKLNERLQRELSSMQDQYSERLRDLERISAAAASVKPSAIERLASDITSVRAAADAVIASADTVKSHTVRYFALYCFLIACAIGIGGVCIYNISVLGNRLSVIAKGVNDALYILMHQ